jgi:hypothetical protein
MRIDSRQRLGRRWPMVVGLLTLALLLPTSAASAAEVLDANCPGPATRSVFSTRGGGQYEAQTFRVLHTGQLTRATLQINNDSGSTDFAVAIADVDANGFPVGGAVRVATIPGGSVPQGPATLDASFSPALPVTAGRLYALVVTRGEGVLTSFSFPAVDGNCSGNTFYNDGPGQPWNLDVPAVDLLYQIFVEPDPNSTDGNGRQVGKGTADFDLVEKKGRLFARVPGPGKLIVDDGQPPSAAAAKHHRRNFVQHSKAVAKKAGDVPLRVELTKSAVRRVLKTHKLNTWGAVTYRPRSGTPTTLVFRIRLKL